MAALVGGKPQAVVLFQAQPPLPEHFDMDPPPPPEPPLPQAAQHATITLSRLDMIRCRATEVNYGGS